MKTIQGYHAHVYFDPDEAQQANTLCQKAGDLFKLRVGRLHMNPIGPHPRGSCQLSFSAGLLSDLLPWLLQNRDRLTVLIHGITGDDWLDHTDYAFWLGGKEPLYLDRLRG